MVITVTICSLSAGFLGSGTQLQAEHLPVLLLSISFVRSVDATLPLSAILGVS